MFKSALWRSEKNKVKVEFKLLFHAAKVPQVEEDALVISLVPADHGKPTVKSERAAVRDGNCFWENPVYETVKFSRDPKSGKIHERIYYFIVGTGSSKPGVVGEASIDFSNYAEATKVVSVSLPLKNSKMEAVLHVSIQRKQDSDDQRAVEENVNAKLNYKEHSLKAHFGNGDIDGILKSNSEDDSPIAELNGNRRTSSGSDITMSSSESSSGADVPWQPQMKNDGVHQEPDGLLSSMKPQALKSDVQTTEYEEHQRSQWEWLGNSAIEAGTDDSSSSPRETLLRQHLEEASNVVIENLKSEVAALSRQAEMSEVELQTLRKQIVKETKRGQDLFKELVCLKEEREALKGECEKLRAFQRRMDDTKTKANLQFEGGDSKAIIDELRQELNHANELNSNLRIQLQKTQESNSELILAVRDLEEMLEQKNREILSLSNGSSVQSMAEKNFQGEDSTRPPDDGSDDEEQKALEEIVKEHGDAKEAYHLEQQIMDMRSEIEIFKRDKDELEMQMEQLALDYEILKQENHDMAYKLEQSQLREQLKLQYECSASYAAVHELETQIESLEIEQKRKSKECEDALVRAGELEAHVKSLEKELDKQSQGFEADLEALARSKVEQEQRAIRAEETLRKMRWQNANTAERLQEEFRRLSVQMESAFATNEKLATKAIAEASELRLQKSRLEEMIKKASEEHQVVKDRYEARLHQLASQVTLMTNQIQGMQSEIEDKVQQLEHQKKYAEETQKLLSDEICKLKDEIGTYVAKNKFLSEEIAKNEASVHQLKQMTISIKEMELLLEQGNEERAELENRITLMRSEAEESQKKLNKTRSLVEEKELTAGNLKSELDSLHSQFIELRNSTVEDELEKEKLRKQVFQLKSDLKKREDAFNSLEKKIKDGSGRGKTLDAVKPTSKSSKPLPRGSKEVTSLKERIKLLEDQIKLKESALETSNNAFLEKEKDLHNKIEGLEGRLEVLTQSSIHYCENAVEKVTALAEDQAANFKVAEEERNVDEDSSATSEQSNVQSCATLSMKCDNNNIGYIDELKSEMALLKERNESMEAELKEMQQRYSEISLKFAEVEGERQQLVMKVRNLKNAKKRS